MIKDVFDFKEAVIFFHVFFCLEKFNQKKSLQRTLNKDDIILQ